MIFFGTKKYVFLSLSRGGREKNQLFFRGWNSSDIALRLKMENKPPFDASFDHGCCVIK